MNRAFSLVELSIVLVILGLLTGGILAGQSLINAAALRSVITEYNSYITANQGFRDRYFALPGDFTKGQSFWGIASASSCVWTATTDGKTCNGDGDGFVNTGTTDTNERVRYWQQLASAGLITGNYNGATVSGVALLTALNTPTSKFNGGLWWINGWSTPFSGASYVFDGDYGNVLGLGALNTGLPYLPLFKPEELWNIDTKLDDGKPATGKVVVWCNGGLSTCTTATGTTAAQAASLTSDYLLTTTTPVAALIVRKNF